ncbi:MAG TPA: hypothetical protein DHW82_11745 [Spirochaetia bacterium]|nr:hypothetical protein [Spirochaetia bacterium]
MMRILKLTLLTVVFVVLSGCNEKLTQYKIDNLKVMGTVSHITVYSWADQKEDVFQSLEGFLKEKSDRLNRYNPLSEVSLFNQAKGEVKVSDDLYKIIEYALSVYRETRVFDITILPIIEIWDYKKGIVPSDSLIQQKLSETGAQNLILKPDLTVEKLKPVRIDLGGIAKGFLIQQAVFYLKENQKNSSGIVEIGGDLLTFGDKEWTIGIVHPKTKKPCIALNVKNKAVFTSGDYERFFEKNGKIYSHILNPLTGRPAEVKAHSVTVIGEDASISDGLATAFFILGPEKSFEIIKHYSDYSVFFIDEKGEVLKDENFPYELIFINEED